MTSRRPQGLQLRRDETYTDEEIEAAFPDVDPGFEPFGSRVIVQLRTPKEKSGSIIFSSETIETEMWNTQIGKIRALGPVAFCNRETLNLWPERAWCQVGDYVRIPKFNQDKWFIEREIIKKNVLSGEDYKAKEFILFMLINDIDLLAKKTGNPLEVKAYI